MKSNQLNEIYIMRALAIMAVLMVHATGTAVVMFQTAAGSTSFDLYNSLNTLFRFGTPTFILLSAFVIFYNYYNRPIDSGMIKRFYSRRLMYILVPYFFVSLGYYWFKQYVYYDWPTFSEFLSTFSFQLLTGSAHAHLYFVFISIQFYLLFPILLYAFQRYRFLTPYLVIIGLAIQWAFVLLNNWYFQVPFKGSWSLSYMAYFFTGAYIGIYFPKIRGWLTAQDVRGWMPKISWALIWSIWGAATMFHVYIWQQNRLFGAPIDSRIFELMWNAQTLTSAILLFKVAFLIYKYFSWRIINPMIQLGVVSFGIYLYHPFLLMIGEALWLPSAPLPVAVFIFGYSFAAVLAICWLGAHLMMKYVPFAWMFVGTGPRVMPFKEHNESPYHDDEENTSEPRRSVNS
ncbi:acyltransferase [Alkalicoccus chagannorensis]|uniref:acyltransferase n=1 Tax=Alkalicoccus chagannorensis TaxID=427072 RepID=UPI00040049C5|nr:acyltransferase [Alkalicoccus chagannorensis]